MERIFHDKYGREGQTVNQHYYVEVLKRLVLAVCSKRPDKRKSRAWAIRHNDAQRTRLTRVRYSLSSNYGNGPTRLTWLPNTDGNKKEAIRYD